MDERPPVDSAPLPPSRRLKFLRRVFRAIWLRVGLSAILEVPGRRTGTPLHVIVIPWEVDGTVYLMSQYGVSDWVRNLRAAGRGELRRKGQTEAFTAIEVDGDERDRVIAASTPRNLRCSGRTSNNAPAPPTTPPSRWSRSGSPRRGLS
jgi:deazaflavin-dependent oxidoreductase (nitroreductase family)